MLAKKIDENLVLNKSYVLEVVYSRDKNSYIAYVCRKKFYGDIREVII